MASLEPLPLTRETTTVEDKTSEPRRESVKEQGKIKKPLTEKRRAQLAAARASKAKKHQERKRATREEKQERPSSRLVSDDGAAASRYLEVLKSNNPDVDISESKPKGKKRKTVEYDEQEMDMGSAAKVGLGLLAAAGISYVAGKNYLPRAIESGFTQPGSGIPGHLSQGIPPIPVQQMIPQFTNGRPSIPSVGYF